MTPEEQNKQRESELKEVPFRAPNKATWPPGVRGIAVGEVDAIGVDANGDLYWHGKRVETRTRLDLDRWQIAIAVVIALGTLVGAAAAVAQGWAAYNEWACKVGWPAICPKVPKVADLKLAGGRSNHHDRLGTHSRA